MSTCYRVLWSWSLCGTSLVVWTNSLRVVYKVGREPSLLMQPAHSSASALCTGSCEITAGMTLSMIAREQKP